MASDSSPNAHRHSFELEFAVGSHSSCRFFSLELEVFSFEFELATGDGGAAAGDLEEEGEAAPIARRRPEEPSRKCRSRTWSLSPTRWPAA